MSRNFQENLMLTIKKALHATLLLAISLSAGRLVAADGLDKDAGAAAKKGTGASAGVPPCGAADSQGQVLPIIPAPARLSGNAACADGSAKEDVALPEPKGALAPNEAAAYPAPQKEGFFRRWEERAKRTQAEQPDWTTPPVTQTARLKQEFRYDIGWQQGSNGVYAGNYGSNKGLELIPAERVEISLLVPPYIVHNQRKMIDGFGDLPMAMRYRLVSANAEHGNYIVTLLLSATVPTGSHTNGSPDASLSPTLAAGKGWGKFDVQSTIGGALPTGDTKIIGRQIVFNTAFQYHLLKLLWPDCEVNSTFYKDGKTDGKKTTYLTPGLVVGRIPIGRSLKIVVGAGEQIAVTQYHKTNHNWILTVRIPF
jgi:hypothetical protein